MSGPTAKPDQSVETAQEDDQESLKQQFQEALSLEVPETAQLEPIIQLLGVFLIGKEKNQDEILRAFSVVNRINYYNDLLKLRYPQTFAWIEENYRIVKREIDRQNNHPKNKGKQLDEYKVRFGLFSQKISREEFIHKSQAYTVASAVHQRVNADDIRNKFSQTSAIYSLTPQSTQELKRSMASWMKENPGRSYDDYMVLKGKQLYLEQQLKPGQKLDRKTQRQLEREHGKSLREKTAAWKKQSDAFRVSTIKSQREMIMRAQEVIKGITIQKGIFTDEQIKQQLDYVLHGKKEAPTVTPTPVATTTVTQIPSVVISETTQTPLPGPYTTTATDFPSGVEHTTPSSTLRPFLESPAPARDQTPNIPAPQISVPAGRFAGLQKFFANFKNSGFGKMLGGLGRGLGIIGGGVGGLLTKGATALASKLGIRAGLGAASGGIYTAASLIAGLFGIDLDKIALTAAKFAVAVPVVLLILILFPSGSNSSTQFPVGAKNATPVAMVSPNQHKPLSWSQFEEKYLTNKPNLFGDINSDWQAFERENLLPQTPYLSLQNSSASD